MFDLTRLSSSACGVFDLTRLSSACGAHLETLIESSVVGPKYNKIKYKSKLFRWIMLLQYIEYWWVFCIRCVWVLEFRRISNGCFEIPSGQLGKKWIGFGKSSLDALRLSKHGNSFGHAKDARIENVAPPKIWPSNSLIFLSFFLTAVSDSMTSITMSYHSPSDAFFLTSRRLSTMVHAVYSLCASKPMTLPHLHQKEI
jgi:hypothetical protein